MKESREVTKKSRVKKLKENQAHFKKLQILSAIRPIWKSKAKISSNK